MRWLALVAFWGCGPQAGSASYAMPATRSPRGRAGRIRPAHGGRRVDRRSADFAFDGGAIDIEMRRDANRVIEVAYNHFAVPIVLVVAGRRPRQNLEPIEAGAGVAVLPAADKPNGRAAGVVLTTLAIGDPTQRLPPR